MTDTNNNQAQNAIVMLLRMADNHGIRIRRYGSQDPIQTDQRNIEREAIQSSLQVLDVCGVPFFQQNAALHWYNECDNQTTWEAFRNLNHFDEAAHILTITL